MSVPPVSSAAERGKPSRYRGSWEIWRAILRTCERGRPTRTHIMYECWLSWRQVNDYTDELQGFITRGSEGVYQVTEKGVQLLNLLDKIEALVHP
jgi:predicted transcriptional regulator